MTLDPTEVRKLRLQGFTLTQVAEYFGVPWMRIYRAAPHIKGRDQWWWKIDPTLTITENARQLGKTKNGVKYAGRQLGLTFPDGRLKHARRAETQTQDQKAEAPQTLNARQGETQSTAPRARRGPRASGLHPNAALHHLRTRGAE